MPDKNQDRAIQPQPAHQPMSQSGTYKDRPPKQHMVRSYLRPMTPAEKRSRAAQTKTRRASSRRGSR